MNKSLSKYFLFLIVIFSSMAIIYYGIVPYSFEIIDDDYQIEAREVGCKNSKTINFGLVYSSKDLYSFQSHKAILFQSELINKQKILDREINVKSIDFGDKNRSYVAEIASICFPKNITACIGPFSSEHIPSSRILTNSVAVPLLSAITVYSEQLPYLENENFATIFPSIDYLTNIFIDEFVSKNYKNILVISPKNKSYGGIFSTLIERKIATLSQISSVESIIFINEISVPTLERELTNILKRRNLDAIFFGGGINNFDELILIFDKLKINLPVYSTELLNNKQIKQFNYQFPLYSLDLKVVPKDPNFVKLWKETFHDEPSFIEILSANLIADVVNGLKEQKYSPFALVNYIKNIAENDFNKGFIKGKITQL